MAAAVAVEDSEVVVDLVVPENDLAVVVEVDEVLAEEIVVLAAQVAAIPREKLTAAHHHTASASSLTKTVDYNSNL